MDEWENAINSKSKLQTIDSLHGITDGFNNEVMFLAFDYLRFHRFCWTVLDDIKQTIGQDLRDQLGSEGLKPKDPLYDPYLVAAILQNVSDINRISRCMPLGFSAKSPMLMRAAECIQRKIDKGAGSIVSNIVERTFNRRLLYALRDEKSNKKRVVEYTMAQDGVKATRSF